MKTKAIVSRNGKDFNFETINLNEPTENEVLVRIIASGICHTDAAVLGSDIASIKPIVLGHEGAGIVEKIGSAVTSVKIGDQVIIGFASCGHCEPCLSAKNGACDNFLLLNSGGRNRYGKYVMHSDKNENISQFFGQSSFSEYNIIHESSLIKIDPHIDLRYVGPLGCGFMTGSGSIFNVIKPDFGTSIVIFGTGAVGLSALMAANLQGCSQIIAVDITNERLELARTLGATHIINSKEENVVEIIHKITDGGANYCFESTGIDSVELIAIKCLRNYGKMIAVGLGEKNIQINLAQDIIVRSLTIRGVMEGDAVPKLFIPKLIQLWELGRFPFDRLIKFYKPENIQQAFEDSKMGKVIKPVLVFDQTYQVKSNLEE